MFLRVLFLIIGLMLGLIFMLNLIYYGLDLKDPFFLPTAVSTIVFLVCWLFFEKFKGPFKAIFRILAVVSLVWAIIVFALVGLLLTSAFPKQGPFESRVQMPDVPPEAELVYDEYLRVKQAFDSQAKELIDGMLHDNQDGTSLDLNAPENASLKTSIDTFLLFFEENQISMPKASWTMEADWPTFDLLETAIKARWLMIDAQLAAGGIEAACADVHQIWRILRQLNSGCSGLSGSVAVYRLSELVITESLQREQLMTDCAGDSLLAVVDELISGLDANLKRSLAVNLALSNKNLESYQQGAKTFDEMFYSPLEDVVFAYSWIGKRMSRPPLYDHQEWLLEADRLFAGTLLPACDQAYHQLGPLPEPAAGISASLRLIKQPAAFYMQTLRPHYRGYLVQKERTKSLLTAFRFLVATAGLEELGDPPVDNLTGEPFLVLHDSLRTRIKSGDKQVQPVDLTLRLGDVEEE